MKITLLSDDAIRLEPQAGPLTIEAPDAEMQYSPFHMLASSLATCTHSVLVSWASNVQLNSDDLVLEVRWEFADDPHRIGRMDLKVLWPSLPENRNGVAERAVTLCPIHATLGHAPVVTASVNA